MLLQWQVDQRTKNTRHYLANQSVRDVFIDHLHNVWVATSNGLFLVNLNDGSYIQYTFTGNDFGLMSNNVHQVRETKEHKLVITTDYGGNIIDLNVYTSPQLQQIKFENISNIVGKLSSPNLRVVRIDQYGNIWAGHKGGGVDFISKLASPFHILNRNSEDKNNNKLYNPVYGLKGFPDGSIFVGRQNEFSLYKNLKEVKTWNILPYINGNLTQVICFQKDNNGRIWIGLREEGALVGSIHLDGALRCAAVFLVAELAIIRPVGRPIDFVEVIDGGVVAIIGNGEVVEEDIADGRGMIGIAKDSDVFGVGSNIEIADLQTVPVKMAVERGAFGTDGKNLAVIRRRHIEILDHVAWIEVGIRGEEL